MEQPDDREHVGCGENWIKCRNPLITHPKEWAYDQWIRNNSKLSVADIDRDGKLGGTQFCISITGTREQLGTWGIEHFERWVKYLKSQLVEGNKCQE